MPYFLICKLIPNFMGLILFIILFYRLFTPRFEMFDLDESYARISKLLLEIRKKKQLRKLIEDNKNNIINLEDKNYFNRNSCSTILSYDLFKVLKNQNKKKIKERIKIKGLSTIEAQIIRSIGLKSGYNAIITRKIYEQFYVKIFLESIYDYYKKIKVVNNIISFKTLLLHVYLSVSKCVFNNTSYTGIYELYKLKKVDLKDLHIIIGVLFFSNYNFNENSGTELYNLILKLKKEGKIQVDCEEKDVIYILMEEINVNKC